MAGFVKLYQTILDSSIWQAEDHVRLVWLTMLAMADQFGVVTASVGGLAHRARVSRDATLAALDVLSSPDSDSKDPSNDGRRIATLEDGGGWVVLNHQKYRELRTPKQVADAKRVADWREKQKQKPVTCNKRTSGNDTKADPEAKAESLPSVEKAPPAPRAKRRFVTREELERFAPQPAEVEAIRRIGRDPAKLVATWRDHHLSKGSQLVDLDASLRTWISREPGFSREPAGKPRQPPGLAEHRRFGGRGDEGASSRPEREEWRPRAVGGVAPAEALDLISQTLSKIGGPSA